MGCWLLPEAADYAGRLLAELGRQAGPLALLGGSFPVVHAVVCFLSYLVASECVSKVFISPQNCSRMSYFYACMQLLALFALQMFAYGLSLTLKIQQIVLFSAWFCFVSFENFNICLSSKGQQHQHNQIQPLVLATCERNRQRLNW